jgi:predicted phage terminase large subunit-like protein
LKAVKLQDPQFERATTAATYLEQGKIWFPRKPWRDEWDTELVTFPHSRHDDQVDVLAYAALQINTQRRHPNMTGWHNDPDLMKPSGF